LFIRCCEWQRRKSATCIFGGCLKRQQERIEAEDRNRTPAIHSLIQTHPGKGRKLLYATDERLAAPVSGGVAG
jgi:hypothetical protein